MDKSKVVITGGIALLGSCEDGRYDMNYIGTERFPLRPSLERGRQLGIALACKNWKLHRVIT